MQPVGVGCTVNDAMPVSILTRPEGRVQRPWDGVAVSLVIVSILTRPEGRVQPQDTWRHYLDTVQVSILTRPEGRVQRL